MMSVKNIVILIIALFVLGCSEHTQENVTSEAVQSPVGTKAIDITSPVSIGPLNAAAASVITLHTNDASLNGSSVHWYINNVETESVRGVRFASKDLKKGDTVKAVIIQNKKEYVSNEISIRNTPPSIHKARIFPALPVVSSRLTVEAAAEDIDNDYISFKYSWTHNGVFAGEESYLEKEFKRGDEITVTVTPWDREEAGKSVTLNSSIVNSLPEVTEGPRQFDGAVYTHQISASDPDGDALTFMLEESPEGMTIDPSSGIITWEAGPADAGIYDFKVVVSDNHGGKIMVPLTTVISSE